MRAIPPLVLLSALLLSACARAPRTGVTPDDQYDLIIENGRVVDGTGSAWFHGDVAVRGDRIARLAPHGVLRGARARTRLDARGMVVAPGFIDIQGQSTGSLTGGDGRVVSKVSQGITTEILGEGSTPAPVSAAMLAADGADASDQRRRFASPRGFDAWLRAMEANGVSPNVGSFVGAGTIRQYGMGMAMGAAPGAALDSMRAALTRAMEDGAFGLASALIYAPGNFVTTDELVEVSKAMAPYGGVYITHMRSEADQLLESIDEAIAIGTRAGVPVEIYHLKAAGERNWSKIPLAIAKIDSARAAGLDVQADMYPYTAGATGLTSCLPPWAAADGKLFENLADSAMRARIRAEVLKPTTTWENLCELSTPQNVLVSALRQPANRAWSGKRLSEIAAAMNRDWVDAAMDLILSERRRVETTYFMMSEANLALQLRQPWMKFGTDASGHDPATATNLVHPRAYGTYPRILGKYVRDERVLPLEDAVRKMSSAVATRLSIPDRGVLREGMHADIVVFDAATIGDRASYEQPHQLPTGMRDVLVNGIFVIRDGKHTGAKPGRAVRGPGHRRTP